MFDTPAEPIAQDSSIPEAADAEKMPEPVDASEAATGREHRRAERVRKAYDSHYLGTP